MKLGCLDVSDVKPRIIEALSESSPPGDTPTNASNCIYIFKVAIYHSTSNNNGIAETEMTIKCLTTVEYCGEWRECGMSEESHAVEDGVE